MNGTNYIFMQDVISGVSSVLYLSHVELKVTMCGSKLK